MMIEQAPHSLVLHYLSQNAGQLLPGLGHNLQNHVHPLKIQLELLVQLAAQAGPQAQKGISRLQQTSQKLQELCSQIEQRSWYTGQEPSPVDLEHFCCWLREFWKHNLFFKHQVSLELVTRDISGLSMLLPPYALTMCLEEGLKNALEACRQEDPEKERQLRLQVKRTEQGLLLELTSPAGLPQGLNPWEPGSSSKEGHLGLGLYLVQYLCRLQDWSCVLEGENSSSRFALLLAL